MVPSIKVNRGRSIVGRLIASLTIGLMLLALGATTAFAATGIQATPPISPVPPIPASNEACKVTYGGRIIAANGDKATFGGNANNAGPSGQEQFQDHGPVASMNVQSIAVSAVTCSPDRTAATILGTATVDGVGPVAFQIDLTDLGEPGRTDTYRLLLGTGYDTGIQLLRGGNVQVHKAGRAAAATPAPVTTPVPTRAARATKVEKPVDAPATEAPARATAATHAPHAAPTPKVKPRTK